jgi:hypothetical protein
MEIEYVKLTALASCVLVMSGRSAICDESPMKQHGLNHGIVIIVCTAQNLVSESRQKSPCFSHMPCVSPKDQRLQYI